MTIHERYPFRWKNDKTPVKNTNANKDIMRQGFEILELKNRTYNALRRNGVNSIGEALERWETIKKLKGMGQTTYGELKGKMCKYFVECGRTDLIERLLNSELKVAV